MNKQFNAIWIQALNLIRENPEVSQTAYEHWIDPLIPVGLADNVLYLKMPTEVHLEIVKGMHLGAIKEAVSVASSGECDVALLDVGDPLPQSLEHTVLHEERTDDAYTLNPKYTFSSFIVGESNRLAHAAAKAVSDRFIRHCTASNSHTGSN